MLLTGFLPGTTAVLGGYFHVMCMASHNRFPLREDATLLESTGKCSLLEFSVDSHSDQERQLPYTMPSPSVG
jgi:hypothetical protein